MEPKLSKSNVRELEYRLMEYFDIPYVISTCNASIAILGSFMALGIRNAEVITTPLTWPGSLTGIKLLGNKLVFADVEPIHLTIDPKEIEKKINKKTKAVFTSDFLGYPCELDIIMEICKKHNIWLIHDAASSFGSQFKAKFSGYYADISIFSFEYNKAFRLGEGGCVVCRNEKIFHKVVSTMCHPDLQYVHQVPVNPFFLKSAISPLAAEFGWKNFDRITEEIDEKREIMQRSFINKGIELSDKIYSPNLLYILISKVQLEKLKSRKGLLLSELPYQPIHKLMALKDKHYNDAGQVSLPIAENIKDNYWMCSFSQEID